MDPTIAKIKQIFYDNNDLYNNFATSNKYVVTCYVSACFNFGEDSGLHHCKEPQDQNHIAQNKPKFQEERYCQSSDVEMEEDILVVAEIITIVGTTNGTSLEWQMPPALLAVEFIA